ncbi:hypothetical protein WLV04_24715 [Bordetella bronchiseptica]|uniref:hypothetical protein n=1 Tax=Bordetella bronchiseptica TaxID=518 RepID=UPI00031E5487|nr:hypothetical protein [Bordetella bronchiseptica]KDS77633.1 hypothetical protein KM22_03431 [Bordetella bronchiseptica KM22]
MTTKHTPGPWAVRYDYVVQARSFDDGRLVPVAQPYGVNSDGTDLFANARLIAAAPELLEALEEAVDLAWIEDSHQVQFDTTVLFSESYDFSGVDGTRRIEFYGQHSCIVWPGAKWSAYCTYDGSMWFEKFDTAEEAKEACMRLLDQVLPDHPAMRARAVIRKAKGEQQ